MSLQIWNEAYTKCSLDGGDPEYDGGCALASSFTQAFAEGCAEAVAEAVAEVNAKQSCDCDTQLVANSTAVAHEFRQLFVHVGAGVKAEACTFGELESEAARFCMAKSVAELAAQVRSSQCEASGRCTYQGWSSQCMYQTAC